MKENRKTYKVTVTETLQRTITVNAEDELDAVQKVQDMYNNEDNDYMNNNSDNNSRNYENVEPDNNQSTGTTGYTTYSHNTGYNQNSAGGAGMNNGQNQYSNGSNNYGYNGYGYYQGGMNNSQYGAYTSYNSTGTNAGYNNTAYNNGANTGFHNASDNSNSTYRYSYVNNNIGSDQNNSYRNAQRAAKQAKKEARKKSFNNWFSKNSTAKKYISGVLAAVVFGVVAGSAMYGTYHIEKKYLGGNDTKNYTISTVTSNIDKVTSDDINANGDTNLSQYSSMNVESVAQAALPAMVALNGTTTVSSSSSMYGWGQQQYEASTSGTGIIVGKNDTELLIVTNAHVVDNVSNLKCVFVDDQSVSATVKGSRSDLDIAVVAVSFSDIPSDTLCKIAIAELAASDTIAVGQQVVAIGNALGEGQSVTNGIISALDRSITDNNVTLYDVMYNIMYKNGRLYVVDTLEYGINKTSYENNRACIDNEIMLFLVDDYFDHFVKENLLLNEMYMDYNVSSLEFLKEFRKNLSEYLDKDITKLNDAKSLVKKSKATYQRSI